MVEMVDRVKRSSFRAARQPWIRVVAGQARRAEGNSCSIALAPGGVEESSGLRGQFGDQEKERVQHVQPRQYQHNAACDLKRASILLERL